MREISGMGQTAYRNCTVSEDARGGGARAQRSARAGARASSAPRCSLLAPRRSDPLPSISDVRPDVRKTPRQDGSSRSVRKGGCSRAPPVTPLALRAGRLMIQAQSFQAPDWQQPQRPQVRGLRRMWASVWPRPPESDRPSPPGRSFELDASDFLEQSAVGTSKTRPRGGFRPSARGGGVRIRKARTDHPCIRYKCFTYSKFSGPF